MRALNELPIQIMRIFGIVEEQTKGCKSYSLVDPKHNKPNWDIFKDTLRSDGPFGISCNSCEQKLLNSIGEDFFPISQYKQQLPFIQFT